MPNVFGVGSRKPNRRWYCMQPPVKNWYCMQSPHAAVMAARPEPLARAVSRVGAVESNTLIVRGKTYPLYDPREVRTNRQRWRRDSIQKLRYANSFYCSGGRWPARGWVLLRKADYDDIVINQGGLYQTAFFINADEFDQQAPQIFIDNLSIIQAQCVTTGITTDADALFLVELTDVRGTLSSPWFQQGANSQYNVRSPAYPDQYYAASLDLGVPWTWDGMVGDLWNQMPLLGTYPGLPSTPTGLPENWKFPGLGIWDAMNDVLEHLGMTVAVNLLSSAPYTIVQSGAGDPVFDALTAQYAGRLEDDAAWVDVGSGRVPGTLVVLFHRRNQYYGTEETVRNDVLQWESSPLYSVSVPAPAFFAGAQGTAYIWDDFQVRYDIDGNPLAADVATAATIAAERGQQFYNDIYSGTLGYMRRLYTGIIPFATGSQVDGVCWRMDFSDANPRAGWRTEIVRQRPPWPEIIHGRRT
jgi:hypothetical protein